MTVTTNLSANSAEITLRDSKKTPLPTPVFRVATIPSIEAYRKVLFDPKSQEKLHQYAYKNQVGCTFSKAGVLTELRGTKENACTVILKFMKIASQLLFKRFQEENIYLEIYEDLTPYAIELKSKMNQP